MRERDIEKVLSNEIKKLGGMSYKWDSPGNAGVPDRIVIIPKGKIFFIELKTDNGRLRKIQEWQQNNIKKLGCDVRTLKGMKEVRDFINEIRTTRISEKSD